MDRARVLDFLNNLNIEYDILEHPAANDAESVKYLDENLKVSTPCKNLFLVNRQGTEFYLLMMPRYKDFRTRFIKEQLGLAHLSFAKEEHMVEILDVHPGSVSIMCLLNEKSKNVHFILDDEVRETDMVRFHVGDNTCSVRVSTNDFINVIIPALSAVPISIDIPR